MSTAEPATGVDGTDGPPADEPVYHRYEPHKAGVPPLRRYLRDLWQRREFAAVQSKATMRAANSMTFFGQAWLVINPLLLAFVYYILIEVIAGRGTAKFDAQRFTHLTGGLFIFYYFQGSVMTGATSVTGAGKIILNTSMPRLLLPLGAVRTGFFRFLPTLPVYLVFHLIAGNPFDLATFTAAPFFVLLLTIFSAGLASLFAALQVYFRDVSAFLPYIMRIWLYVSPVLWTIDQIKGKAAIAALAPLNPLYSIIGGYGEALQAGKFAPWSVTLTATAWALGAGLVGFLFFVSRERDFAVRL